MSNKVVEVFGKFAAEIDGNIVTFDDRSAAETAVVMAEKAEEMAERADAYCTARNLVDKNAVAKKRIIMDFIAFEATVEATEVEEDTTL